MCVFQVQKDNVTGTGWNHDRIYYYYARWTGTKWQRRFIAHAGRPLYSAEDEYGGGMCIDPEDPRVVYVSTNAANPFATSNIDDVPLRGNERYEIFRGFTDDGGLTFSWTQITNNSSADNLRPIVPLATAARNSLSGSTGPTPLIIPIQRRCSRVLVNSAIQTNFKGRGTGRARMGSTRIKPVALLAAMGIRTAWQTWSSSS